MTPRNVKADMLAVLTGRPVERIPWVPRLDLWYRANRQAGTLPPGFADAPLEAILFEHAHITIMGGIPSVTLLEQTMDDNQFDAFLDPFFGEEIGRGDHLILGISDTTPPGAKFDRLCLLRDRIAAFGPVA